MPFKDMEEYLKTRVTNAGLSWETLRKEGVIMGTPKPITVDEGLALEFDTPSKKGGVRSDQLAMQDSTRYRSSRATNVGRKAITA